MRAIDPPNTNDIFCALDRLIDERVAAPLALRDITLTAAARDLLLGALLAQVKAGIVRPEHIVAATERLGFDGLSDFYLMKFGPRPLTYNRMIRLLADMHDKWIRLRHADSEVTSASDMLVDSFTQRATAQA